MKTKYGIDENIINGQRYYMPKRKLGPFWFYYKMQGHKLKFIHYDECQEWLIVKTKMSFWEEIKDYFNVTVDFYVDKFCIFHTCEDSHVQNGVMEYQCVNYYSYYWYYTIYFLWFEMTIKRPS